MSIRSEITAFFSAALLAVLGVACQSDPLVLGSRDNTLASAGGGAGVGGVGGTSSAAGSGGSSNTVGGRGGASGSVGQAGGSGGSSGMTGSSGAVAIAGNGGGAAIAGGGGSDGARMSAGCGRQPPPTGTDTRIDVAGMQGSYIVDLPPGYDESRPYPLVMSFRGGNVSVEDFRGYLNLPPAVGANAIVISANCLNNAPSWDVGRDLPLFDMLLAKLETTYCIDEDRIFAVGHTSGGYFTNALGCLRADKLRAIAPLSAAGPPTATCQGQAAVWISQGNADAAIAVEGGRANRDFWAERNQCDVSMPVPVNPSPCVEYGGCDSGFSVRYCEYDGMLGLPDFAAAAVWAFFEGL